MYRPTAPPGHLVKSGEVLVEPATAACWLVDSGRAEVTDDGIELADARPDSLTRLVDAARRMAKPVLLSQLQDELIAAAPSTNGDTNGTVKDRQATPVSRTTMALSNSFLAMLSWEIADYRD